jgi:hypothetical protein
MIPGLSTAKLIGLAIAAAAILSFVLLALHWKNTMTERGQKLEIICKATREAAAEPKLDCGNVVIQIEQLGTSLKTVTRALNDQSAAVAAMGEQTKAQQAATAQASQKAQERAGRAEATANRLTASSRAGEAQAKPCAPSKALQEQWR